MKRNNPNFKGSYFRSFREKRLRFFIELLNTLNEPEINILDAGGTVLFWRDAALVTGKKIRITVLNLMRQDSDKESIVPMVGDARDMSYFKDGQFDVVFSNSVIEHVGAYEDQRRMAEEIRRVGRSYFVQTPSYYFPLEAHFLFPLFQFLPIKFRIFLLMHFDLGYYKKMQSREDAMKVIQEIRLLKAGELKELFPDGTLAREKLLGLTKSLISYRFEHGQTLQ